MKKQVALFFARWILSSLGLWVAVRLLGTGYDDEVITAGFGGFVIAGFILASVTTFIKPLLVFISLPAILLTLGLFTLILNGLIVYYSLMLTPGFSMSFGNSILTGIILSLVNYIVSTSFDLRRRYARSM